MAQNDDLMLEFEKSVWSREFEPKDGKPSEDSRVTRQELYEAVTSLKPIRIRWAILPEGVNFRHGQIARELVIENCEVHGSFILENVLCAESLVLTGTVFRGGLKLNGTQIKGSLQTDKIRCESQTRADGSVISGKAELKQISIDGQWKSNGATFSDGIDVEYSSFRGPVSLQSCAFEGEQASFALATYHQVVDFWGSRFSDTGATFTAASFRNHFLFNNIRCLGELIFSFCKIEGSLTANQCWFWQDAQFTSATISGKFLLDQTACHGVFNCMSLNVGAVVIDRCRFSKNVLFNNSSMQSLTLSRSILTRKASCMANSVDIKGKLDIHTCRFGANLSLVAANLGSLMLGWDEQSDPTKDVFANFHNSNTFLYRDMYLTGTHIQATMVLYRVLCLGKSELSQMTVGATTDVSLCRFGVSEAPNGDELLFGTKTRRDKLLSRQREIVSNNDEEVNFNRSEFRGRVGIHSVFHRPAHFHGIHCHGPVRFLSGCVFYESAEFYFASFSDEANFGGAEFKGKVNLNNAQFARVLKFESLRPHRYTKFGNGVRINIGECKYESLQGLTKENLACFLKHVDGGRSSFIFLEQFYRRVGNTESADFVRRFWRGCEGNDKRGVAWAWDQLLRRTTGYGTNFVPLLMTLLALGIIDVSVQITSIILELRNPNKLTIATAATRIIHLVLTAFLTVGAVVLGDTFRRGLWPDKT